VSEGQNHMPTLSTAATPTLQGPAVSAAAETSIRQLIANGKHRAALESAKRVHKEQGTAASEALLVEAYAARIQSLIRQNMTVEAKSLIELVGERYPSARARLDELSGCVAARAGALDELVQPLADPALSAERRGAIETAIEQQVWDLAGLAQCAVLPPEHPLRAAASALEHAFVAVTSGFVAEDALELPEVSHRSPLAPWKLLVRAIACFYRQEVESCRRCLDGIKPDSAPARLVPAIRAMLSGATAAPLTPAASALVSQTTANSAALGTALEALDRSFASGKHGRILKASRAAVEECRQLWPGQLERLRQHITVSCLVAGLDAEKVAAATGEPARYDASFVRLLARAKEAAGDPEDLVVACGLWDEFRQLAAREGWFSANGAEAATLYLHMAEVMGKIPDELLGELQKPARLQNKKTGEDLYFLFPERLFERACALDPHFEAFSQWMGWASRQSRWEPERVAETWHTIRPMDLEPILYLMEETAKRNAFHTALLYLDKAERIDSVHPAVRRARLRLLAGSALRHIQQKKPKLAEEKVAEMAALPQSQQGDRPAFLAALRYMAAAVRGDAEWAAAHRGEIEGLLESSVAAALLIFAVAAASKRSALEKLGPIERLSDAEQATLPAALARVAALAEDMNVMKVQIPWTYLAETAKQLARSSRSLATGQLRTLAEAALCANHLELAYAASAAGLERGGATEARFLLLRARSLPNWQVDRRAVCAAAAAELARQQRDLQLVEEAVELVRGRFDSGRPSIALEQAAEVLRREKAAPALSTGAGGGPDYRDLLADELCQCLDCRRARGEIAGPSEDVEDVDEEMERIFAGVDIPKDIPSEVAKMLFQETRKAVLGGESLDELLSRLIACGFPGKRPRKGRRR